MLTRLTRDEVIDLLLTAIRNLEVTGHPDPCRRRLAAARYLARAAWLALQGDYGPDSEFCRVLGEVLELLHRKQASKPPSYYLVEELQLKLCFPVTSRESEIARQLASGEPVELDWSLIE